MKINISNLDIRYEESISNFKYTAFIVHGWGANFPSVKPIFQYLKHHMNVVAIELPGHGESEKPKEVFGTSEYADIVEEFIRKKGLKNIYYFGHSFGGKIGIILSLRNIDAIKKFIFIDASGIKPTLTKKELKSVRKFKFKKKLYKFFFGEKNLDKFYKRYGSSDYKSADGIMRNILVKVVNEDFTDKLSGINKPVKLIWGKDDNDTPLYMAKKMNELIKASQLSILDGGHYSYLDDFNGFKNAISDIIDEVNDGSLTL